MGIRHRHRFLGRTLLSIAAVLACAGVSPAGEPLRFDLKKVFVHKLAAWKSEPLAFLGPKADSIYLFVGPEIQVISRKTGTVVASASFAKFPCDGAREFYAWEFLPNRSEVVANYCMSLFLVNLDTLEVTKTLFRRPGKKEEEDKKTWVRNLAISRDGRTVVVLLFTPGRPGPRNQVTGLDPETWEVVGSWLTDHMGVALSSDGRLLAVNRRIANKEKGFVKCGVEVRRLPAGGLYSDWWFDKKKNCPSWPVFTPGNSRLLTTQDGRKITVWDVNQGKAVKVIENPRPIMHLLFSPDGKWVVADVSNDPQDTPKYSQDFVVWDLSSGTILYESRKKKWSLWAQLRGYTPRAGFALNDISKDGKYLLVTKYKHLILYEVLVQHGEDDTATAGEF